MSNCQVSLHEFPHFGEQGSHYCQLDAGHGGAHACPCGRLLMHYGEARAAENEAQDFEALLDLYN